MKWRHIFILFKKDLSGLIRDKAMISSVLGTAVMIVGAMTYLEYLIKIKSKGLLAESQNTAINLEQFQLLEMSLYLWSIMLGFQITFLLIFREKIQKTLLALLTTPIKPAELILGKISLVFLIGLLGQAFIFGADFFINSSSNFNPLAVINAILLLLFICLIGVVGGLYAETQVDQKNIMGYFTLLMVIFIGASKALHYIPGAQDFHWFNPLEHFVRLWNEPSQAIMLFHTGFNVLSFCAVFVFTVFYIRFYFSNNKERRFSLKLAGCLLGGLAMFCALSGFTTPPLLNKLKSENTALLALREEAKKTSAETAKEGLIPLKDFIKKSAITGLKISPDGKYLAYLKPYQKRMNIYVRKINEPESEQQITNQRKRDIGSFAWKENNSLIYMKDFEGDENYHVFRVFADGRGEKDLTPFKETKVMIVDLLDNISDDSILISMNRRDKTIFDVYRLNVKTGQLKMIAENPGTYTKWLTDHNGKLKAAMGQDKLDISIYWRETEEGKFKEIKRFGFKDDFSPLMFDFDNKNLYVLSNLGRDKLAIELFDPKQNKRLSVLFSHPEVDVSGLGYSKKRKVLTSISYTTWKTQRHFLDPEYERIYKDIQSKIPGKEISISSMNREENLMTVFSYSDKSPGDYWLYDADSKKLKFIASTRPWIKESDMAEMRPMSYKSRDGLNINGYLTLPKGSAGKNLQLLVIPHGGPWARDHWGYQYYNQFFASRGLAVFQMNYRGSIGYGKKFWASSFKQWGRKMQDDITDGVLHLIESGLADKKKIAIFGVSYGGYATLAGLAFTPDLYACGVDYVGVSNLFTSLKSIPPYWQNMIEQFYEMIGHPEKDKELLKAVSPLFHADKIKAPLFVIQGARDPRVKKQESDQIVKALKEKGIEVPYLVKANEGHGFILEENQLEVYALIEAFLKKCLK